MQYNFKSLGYQLYSFFFADAQLIWKYLLVLWSANFFRLRIHLIPASVAQVVAVETPEVDGIADKFRLKQANWFILCFFVWHVALFQRNKHIITWTRDSICLQRVLFTEISYAQTATEKNRVAAWQERQNALESLEKSQLNILVCYLAGNEVPFLRDSKIFPLRYCDIVAQIYHNRDANGSVWAFDIDIVKGINLCHAFFTCDRRIFEITR